MALRRTKRQILELLSLLTLLAVALWTTTHLKNPLGLLPASGKQEAPTTMASVQNEEEDKEIDHTFLALEELVDTQPEMSCPVGLVLVEDVRNSTNITQSLQPRKIPRVIHVTSKSRCVTPQVAECINKWKSYPDHQFYFHNDAAIKRLVFEKEWPEFPLPLHLALKCSNAVVEVVDLWRALVLWEYGGIYTDIDNIPKEFNPSLTLQPDDEAYFEVERGRWLSQYFFAAAPKHPLMYLLVLSVWERLFTLQDIGLQYAPYHTGPGALKQAMKHFMRTHQMIVDRKKPWLAFEKVTEGHYVGLNNRTVTVAPMSSAVFRSALGKKGKHYGAMGMSRYDQNKRLPSNTSCFDHLYLYTWKPIEQEQGRESNNRNQSSGDGNSH